jgi:hypothetical protein
MADVTVTSSTLTDMTSNVWELDTSRIYDTIDVVLDSYTKVAEAGIVLTVKKIYVSGKAVTEAWIGNAGAKWSATFTASVTDPLVWEIGGLYNVDKLQIKVTTTTPTTTAGTAVLEVIQNRHN